MRIAVVGAGLLGSIVALFAAARGWEVEVLDSRPEILSAASCANEGKVHLGPIFALGDAETQEVMLRGALSFASIVEDALGTGVDWGEMSSAPFDYIVMPTSLLDAPALAQRYSAMNARFEQLSKHMGSHYLGGAIDHLVDPEPRTDESTGFPMFATAERAVDPIVLCRLVSSRIASATNIAVRASHRVISLDPAPTGVEVSWRVPGGSAKSGKYDFVVNCAWENQLALDSDPDQGRRNFRVKTAVRLRGVAGTRTVTLAQGPFGDVVSHRDYTYASWYPEARLTNEFGTEPSDHARTLLERITAADGEDADLAGWRTSIALRQLAALRELGLLPDFGGPVELVGGVIVGHGSRDIDDHGSRLHSRAEFGTRTAGRLLSPRNFKLTTAPLAARHAIESIDAVLNPTVLA